MTQVSLNHHFLENFPMPVLAVAPVKPVRKANALTRSVQDSTVPQFQSSVGFSRQGTALAQLSLQDPQTEAVLAIGSQGQAVHELQALLDQAGYPVTPDGDFGMATEGKLKHFQKDHKLPITGVLDVKTRDQLKETAAKKIRGVEQRIEELSRKIQAYQGRQANNEEARRIAQAVLKASQTYQISEQILLATLAHESVFSPRVDRGNGVGLGQLTPPAVQELRRISRGGSNGSRAGVRSETYRRLRTPESKKLFADLTGPRSYDYKISIEPNVMASAAYLRLMLDIYGGNTRSALSYYNGAGGAIQRAYPGKVAQSYQKLYGQTMPGQI